MGIRGEIYSTTVGLQNRTYFFNVKENRMGDLYLNIVESKNKETGGFDRQSVILFADDLPEFLKGFDDSLRVLEKAVKEKRRSAPRDDHPRKKADAAASTEDTRGKKRYTGKSTGDTPRKPGSNPRSTSGTVHRGKPKAADGNPRKVVVRKRDRDE
ncbi:hypothetical protein AGMMS49944_13280 [Spirochaetia bacterium]|nr:hypothetical protein AGMMS49944_13280 [Spirochaetia bacterium]